MPRGQKKISEYAKTTRRRQTDTAMASKAGNSPQREQAVDPPGLANILTEIKQMRTEINTKIDTLDVKFNLLQAHVDKITASIKEAEERIGATEDKVAPMERTVGALERELAELKARVIDQEGRCRRNNIRVVGFPEGAEKTPAEPYFEALMRELFPDAKFSEAYVIERAHRALQRRPPPGSPPRPVILRCLNYRDRDEILKAARLKGSVRYQGAQLSFYQDFTMEVQGARRNFMEVKKTLREKNIQYAMLYPSKLRIAYQGKVLFFTDHAAALDFAKEARQNQPNNNAEDVERRAIPDTGSG